MIADRPDPIALPAGLRERVLQASQSARAAGTSVPHVPTISPSEAFCRSADAFYALLCALGDSDWQRPVLRELTVQGLVGHLIGVEYDVHRALNGDAVVADREHVESTQAEADRQDGRAPATTRNEWRAAAERTIDLVAGLDPDGEVAIHRMRLDVGSLLLVRAFELWTHENDIRGVTGLPPSVPDPSTLQLMTNLAARALPVGADRIGLDQPLQVRLALIGLGGGTWDLALGDAPSEPPRVRIIADTVDFCRLVANRAAPGDLDLQVSGDPEQATQVLAAFAALALD